MNVKKVEALKGIVVAVLALLVAKGLLIPGDSDTIKAVVDAVLVAAGAFGVHPFGTANDSQS